MDSVCLTNPADIAPLINRGKEELPKASMIYSPLDKVGVHSCASCACVQWLLRQ